MTILCDREIIKLCEGENFMINPFVDHQIRYRSWNGIQEKIISYGTSSFGYDLRLGYKFKIFSNVNSSIVDPKNFDNKSFVEVEVSESNNSILIPPNSFILAHSFEYIKMPRDVVGLVMSKSTIARSGIICIPTIIEPEWEGYLTLEYSNTSPLPAKLYAGEGACQIVFYRGQSPDISYADRGGKYQYQAADAITPRV